MTSAKKQPSAKKKPSAKSTSTTTTNAAAGTIAGYIEGLDGWQAAVVRQLCALVEQAAPDATGSIKWAQPVFEDHGPFCYVRAFASHVNFGFWRGAALGDPKGRLHGSGKTMAHVKITGPQDIDTEAFTKLVEAAVKLNRSEGDPTKARARHPRPRRD
jgi:hypothetical protein